MIEEYSFINILVFAGVVCAALVLDLHVHKKNKVIPLKSAVFWSAFWVFLSFVFAVYLGVEYGADKSSLFLTGYLLEKSLSVDNLFVFMAVFSAFGIKDQYQHRVLYYGIIGALILRIMFIAAGSSVLLLFGKWALVLFAVFILWSALKMWQAGRDTHAGTVDYTNHWCVRSFRHFFGVYPFCSGNKFFIRKDGRWLCTPLFLCLIVIEVADIMFAFDSVPAVLAITQEPFLVYTSNVFAILGLRSMYFLLSAAKRCLCYLEKSVILVLLFIGVKMLFDVFNIVHVTPLVSLSVVASLLFGGVVLSLMFPAAGELQLAAGDESLKNKVRR